MTDDREWKKVEMNPTWDYKTMPVNSTLTGVLTKIEEGVGKNASTLYTIQQKTGENVSVWGCKVLDARLKNLPLGEEVQIVYLGLAKSNQKGSKDYHNFDIFHREAAIIAE